MSDNKCSGYVNGTCIHGHLEGVHISPVCYGDPRLDIPGPKGYYGTLPATWTPPCQKEDCHD